MNSLAPSVLFWATGLRNRSREHWSPDVNGQTYNGRTSRFPWRPCRTIPLQLALLTLLFAPLLRPLPMVHLYYLLPYLSILQKEPLRITIFLRHLSIIIHQRPASPFIPPQTLYRGTTLVFLRWTSNQPTPHSAPHLPISYHTRRIRPTRFPIRLHISLNPRFLNRPIILLRLRISHIQTPSTFTLLSLPLLFINRKTLHIRTTPLINSHIRVFKDKRRLDRPKSWVFLSGL